MTTSAGQPRGGFVFLDGARAAQAGGAAGLVGGGDGEGLAETRGFEPPVPVSQYNGLANRRLQPLGHVSGRTGYSS